MNTFTKITTLLTAVFLFIAQFAFSANFAIIESQSFHPLQNMDAKWETIIQDMGHTATVVSQTALDDISSLAGFDILIISNGLVSLTPAREDVIYQFVAQGGNTYLQSEYQATQPGNKAYKNVVNQLGGTFDWTGESTGNLIPMNIFGDLSNNVKTITSIDHFWYGAYGSGDANTIPFLEYQGNNYGFIYCSTNSSHGKLVTTADQDWIRLDFAKELAENIVHFLATAGPIDVPSIFVTISDTEPCDGEPITFAANLGSTTATINYQWVVNSVPVPGATEESYTAVFAQGDLVYCNITFSDGCSSEEVNTPPLEVNIVVPIFNNPTLSISTTSTNICSVESVTALATGTSLNGLTNISYQWTLNNENIPGATNTTFQINTLNDGDIINCNLSFDNPCGNLETIISNNLTFTVNISTTPLVTINSDFTNICAGEAINFTADVTEAGSNPTYQWQVDGNDVGTNSSTFSTNQLTDAQVVTCKVTSNDACATTPIATSNGLGINISTPAIPGLDIQADQTVTCPGEFITFTSTGTDLGSNPEFTWYIDGVPTGTNSNTFTTNNITNGQAVTCEVLIAESCVTTNTLISSPIIIEITSIENPTIEITSDATSVCGGGTITFTATGTHLGDTPQYEWLVNGTTTGNTTATYVASISNEQTISCIVTTNNDCSNTLTATSNEIEVMIGNLVLDVMEIQPDRCEQTNGSVRIEATGGVAPYTLNWDNNQINTNEITNLAAGNYSVIATDVNGCSANIEINIPSTAGPQIASLDANHINCSNTGGSAIVVMENPNAPYFYAWKNDDNETIANTSEIQNLQEGLYFVEVTDAFGCMVAEEIYIEAFAPLQLEILEETTIELGEDYKLQVVTNSINATFSWKDDGTLSCTDCMNPTVQPIRTTTYQVRITTAEGCTADAHVTIYVNNAKKVFVPNAFSPNNDGLNDIFSIYGGDDVSKVKTFQVFDRWGTVVYANDDFQVNDESAGWDGTIGNKTVTTGVFIYFAEIEFIDGRTEIFKGDVTATK